MNHRDFVAWTIYANECTSDMGAWRWDVIRESIREEYRTKADTIVHAWEASNREASERRDDRNVEVLT